MAKKYLVTRDELTNLSYVPPSNILNKLKTVDGSGSGLDADTVDGIHAASFIRNDSINAGKSITFKNASGKSSSIVFHSYVNYGSDKAIIRYDDDNNSYNLWGDTSENSALVIRVENDGAGGVSDIIAFESPAAIFLNAPYLYRGDKNRAHLIWHSGNDGSGSGLDADTVDGFHASDLINEISNSLNVIDGGDANG